MPDHLQAQTIWKTFCGELRYDKGVKDTEDVRQALSTVLRKIVSDNEGWIDGTYMIKSNDILDIADGLEQI